MVNFLYSLNMFVIFLYKLYILVWIQQCYLACMFFVLVSRNRAIKRFLCTYLMHNAKKGPYAICEQQKPKLTLAST